MEEEIYISVILPVYNAEKFINRCIESMLNQTFSRFELIIINDGSMDSSLEICKMYEARDNRIRLFSNENKGVSFSRNFGIKKSRGKYVYFIDSDDWIESNTFETMYELAKDGADLVIGGATYEYISDKAIKKVIPEKTKEEYFWISKKNLVSFIWNKLYKKEIIVKNNIEFPTDLKLGEDLLFNFTFSLQCNEIIVFSKANYHYILHETNSVYKLDNRSDIFKVLKRILVEIDKEDKKKKILLEEKIQKLSVVHIKAAFTKFLNASSYKEFIKYYELFLKETDKLDFLNKKNKKKVYIRARIIKIIYILRLRALLKIKNKLNKYLKEGEI